MSPRSIPLSAAELESIKELRAKYDDFPASLFEDIEELFRQTRILLTRVAEGSEGELHRGQLALMGIIYRTYDLLRGGIQQIPQGNKHVWGACLRGLVETFGAVVFVNESPGRLLDLVQGQGVNPGKLRNAAYRKIKELKDDFKRLDKIVHPGSTSLLLGLRVFSKAQKLAIFAVPPSAPSTSEAQEALETLMAACDLIHGGVRELLESHPELISCGKSVAQIVWKGMPPNAIQ